MVQLQNEFCQVIDDSFNTIDIKQEVNKRVKDCARALLTTTATTTEIAEGAQPNLYCYAKSSQVKNYGPLKVISPSGSEGLLYKMNEERLQKYRGLMEKLCNHVESGDLHWRHQKMALVMLLSLARRDLEVPAKYIRVFVNNLIHDNIILRNSSLRMVGTILQLQKRIMPKVEFVPIKEGQDLTPGDRQDNLFMCYNSEASRRTEQEWNELPFVDKHHLGYYRVVTLTELMLVLEMCLNYASSAPINIT